MKMAKASEADLNMAMSLCNALESLARGLMPKDARAPEDEDNEDFDSEDSEHCYRALNEVLRIVRRGSIGRVVWGMEVLLDPANKVVDPAASTLEYHPDTVAANRDAERYRWLAGNGWVEAALYATGPREWGANGVALLCGPQLDSVIDAAMQAR